MLIAVHRDGITARWAGGPHISLYREPFKLNVYGIPFDSVNVWDYGTDTARIPFTEDAVAAKLDAYLSEPRHGIDTCDDCKPEENQ